MKKAFSTLYTRTGDGIVTPEVTIPSPPKGGFELAASIVGGRSPANIFGRPTLGMITDAEIPDRALRVFSLISALGFREGSVVISYEEIGSALSRSPREIKRHVAILIQRKLLTCIRRHNVRNEYVLPSHASDAVQEPQKSAPKSPPVKCNKCSRACRKVGPTGWCRSCMRQLGARRAVLEAKNQLPAGSSDDQIIQKVLIEKTTKKYLKPLRELEQEAAS